MKWELSWLKVAQNKASFQEGKSFAFETEISTTQLERQNELKQVVEVEIIWFIASTRVISQTSAYLWKDGLIP